MGLSCTIADDFASAVILRYESRWTLDQILLSQIDDLLNLEGQVPAFISLRNRVARLYPQALGSLLVVSYDSQGYDGCTRYSKQLPHKIANIRTLIVLLLTPLQGPSIKHRFQTCLYCCMCIRCRENVFTDPLLRNGPTRYSIVNYVQN
jgi:hypothetical protein